MGKKRQINEGAWIAMHQTVPGLPVLLRERNPREFLPEKQEAFFERLGQTFNIRLACEHAGVSTSTVDKWRKYNAEFSERFDEALLRAYLVLAAAGGAGWRGARVHLRPTAGAPLIDLGVARPVAVIGTVESAPAYGGSAIIDRDGVFIVVLHSSAMTLMDATDADLLAGANLAAAGSELFQFGRAEPLGDKRWRLSALLRGRFGSEDGAFALAGGEPFILIDDPDLFPVPMAVGLAMTRASGAVTIQGTGDAAPIELAIEQVGRATLPLSPVHLRCVRYDDGGIELRWVRRSRSGFAWIDGLDAPFDVRVERYCVAWRVGARTGEIETNETRANITASQIAELRAEGGMLEISIVQVGDAGASPPLRRTIAIG